MWRHDNALLLAAVLPFLVGHVQAQDSPNLHLLGISSGHFGRSMDGPSSLTLPGAHLSAHLVLRHLKDRVGATTATLLRSDEHRLVSKSDVFDALERLASLVRKTPGQNVVIVYIIGHGFGEGFAWSYFVQPGNVVLSTDADAIDISRFDIGSLASHLIPVGEIVDVLNAMDARYVLLVDSCYEGDAQVVEVDVFSAEATRNITDVQHVLRRMNEFRGSDPVVFSTTPGAVVRTVPIPGVTGPLSTQRIGPLARRVLVSLDSEKDFDVTERWLVEKLLAAGLDQTTSPAISFAAFAEPFALMGPKPSAKIRVIWGTAGVDGSYALQPDAGDDELNVTTPRERVSSARLAFDGPAEEWVSDGKRYRFEGGKCPFAINNWELDKISLLFCDDWTWSVSFAVPNGEKFELGEYTDAVRYSFQQASEPALEITGDGRGCSEIAGEFTVNAVEYTEDRLVALAIAFSQICDGAEVALTGTFAVKR